MPPTSPRLSRHLPPLLALTAALACATPALAHPQPFHSPANTLSTLGLGFIHPLTGLDHLAAALTVGLLASQHAARSAGALIGAFLLAIVGGFVAARIGLVAGGPLVEHVVAASVFVLGAVLFSANRFGAAPLSALFIAFGLFHGAAHAADPLGASTDSALLTGLLAGTALVVAAGLLVGRSFMARPVWLSAAGAAVSTVGVLLFVLPL